MPITLGGNLGSKNRLEFPGTNPGVGRVSYGDSGREQVRRCMLRVFNSLPSRIPRPLTRGLGFPMNMNPPDANPVSLAGLSILLLLGAGPVRAQTDSTPVELSETNYFGMGARAMGMGTAFVGISDDVSAMFYNPAGLTQIRRVDLSGSLSIDSYEVITTHVATRTATTSHTRLENFSIAFPIVPHRGTSMGFAFRRYADLDQVLFREGFLVQPTTAPSEGLFELESYERRGSINAWTGAVAFKLNPRISLGGSVSYLSGSTHQNSVFSNLRATVVGNDIILDTGSPSDPDERVFEEIVYFTDANMYGWTGAAGILFEFDHGLRLGGNFEFPSSLRWDGITRVRLEDTIGFIPDENPETIGFRDNITMPLTISGGLSWKYYGLLLSGGMRWTDYRQINFDGARITAASDERTTLQRVDAYRSVVAINVGVEWQTPTRTPFFFRGGFYTKPLPYDRIAADPDFQLGAETSVLTRDYPRAEIVSDQHFFTLGAGIEFEKAISFDLAFQRGKWKRSTPSSYENSTAFYPTTPTMEDVTQDRWFLSTTAHFR